MPKPPQPPEETAQLMKFIAEKAKNVKSPLNVAELCRQFKEKTGTLVSLNGLKERVRMYRHKIHELNEFDMVTKVKMMFALGASIDAGFLNETKKVAEVEVDDQQRLIRYKQNDGELELSGKHSKVPRRMGEQRGREIIQFLADKSKTTNKPIAGKVLLREFKKKTGYTDSIDALEKRYQRVKETIYHLTGIDKNTKIKMMFISNVTFSEEILKTLRKDADVEVDEEGRITKYKANNGSLKLDGSHEMSIIMKSAHSHRWGTLCEKANENESEVDDDKDANYQNDYEKERIELVRFIIKRTKHATSPLSIKQMATDYKKEFKRPEPLASILARIQRFRQRIHEMNQFDTSAKVKMMFALSSAVDAKFLKELQKCAIVQLDEKQRIKKYKANDESLELEGDHSLSAKSKAGWAERKKRRGVTDSSESEDVGDEKDSSESDESEEEEDGDNGGESMKSNQTPTSSSVKRGDRLRKSKMSLQNNNKKRQFPEKNSDSAHTPNHARMSRRKKRARISYSSSEDSEEEPKEEDEESVPRDDDSSMDNEQNDVKDRVFKDSSHPKDSELAISQSPTAVSKGRKRAREVSEEEDDGRSLKLEDDWSMDFDYDPSNYELDIEHIRTEKKPESLIEVKTEESSTNIVENHYEDSFFQYDLLNDVDDTEHIPEEMKPESLLEVKTELPQELSTSNIVYHYEENLEHILTEPKPENI